MIHYNANEILSFCISIFILFIIKFKLLFKRNYLIQTIMNLVLEVFYIFIVYIVINLKLWLCEIVCV